MRLLILLTSTLHFLTSPLFGRSGNDSTTVVFDSTFVVQLNPRLPPIAVQFRLVQPKDCDTTYYSLVVYRPSPTRLYQDTIQVIADSERADESMALYGGFEFQDMNFDGYLDILCAHNVGNHGDVSYMIWLFNPSTFTFEYNEDFSNLGGNPTPDESSHCISVGGTTCAFGCFYTATYHVENNKLTLIAETTRDMTDHDSGEAGAMLFHEVRRKLIDGVWLVTLDKIGTAQQLERIY